MARCSIHYLRPTQHRKLAGRALIFTLIRKAGYVGVGIITGDTMPSAEATVDLDGRQRLLADLPLADNSVYADGDEWVAVICRRSMQEVTCHLRAGMFG